MLTATCHCGAIRVEVPRKPRMLSSCNCSACRRYGALMAYYHPASVRVRAAPGALSRYAWGDKTINFVFCRNCGCLSHWEPRGKTPRDRMGVNARNFEPAAIAGIRVRRFDGASSWKYLD